MRTLLFLVTFGVAACSPAFEGDTGSYDGDDFNDDDGGAASLTIDVFVGYCALYTYSLETGEEAGPFLINEDGSGSDTFFGGYAEMVEVFCDASVVPQYDLPAISIGASACPIVECNPHGGAENGEKDDCGEDLWVYAYPEAYYQGSWSDCGPWNLN